MSSTTTRDLVDHNQKQIQFNEYWALIQDHLFEGNVLTPSQNEKLELTMRYYRQGFLSGALSQVIGLVEEITS